MKEGFRIYEIDEKTRVPKEIKSGSFNDVEYMSYNSGYFLEQLFSDLDLDNKTYAIRIGKTGLK